MTRYKDERFTQPIFIIGFGGGPFPEVRRLAFSSTVGEMAQEGCFAMPRRKPRIHYWDAVLLICVMGLMVVLGICSGQGFLNSGLLK